MKVLAWLLHHANRFSKDQAFYKVKDRILSKHGKQVGYDIQSLPGKKCFSCHGTGRHARWDQYGIYDPQCCWRCAGNGWFKDPQWVCLSRIEFKGYVFHKPLKREYSVKNPFSGENMGWLVSDRPVIDGYIRHEHTWFAVYALMVIYLIYDRSKFLDTVRGHLKTIRGRIGWRWFRFKLLFRKRQVYQYANDPDSDLPF